ncbi:F-box WD repeat-containing 7-like [Brachionus plicatilis]|uniref:F-box WD repeat-containing 7-like n=1 Tax=Brachionus plicatilis TaxID=10195 RepID=A0A3M7PHV3_BRAPC|nr:F-box WD repeat-containing 7-like [Brachionus plicatilis]
MSLNKLERICDYCDGEEDLVLILPCCEFQLCEKHLIENAEKNEQEKSKPVEERTIKCPFCISNSQHSCDPSSDKDYEFTIQKCKEFRKNQLRIKIRQVEKESDRLLSNIVKFYPISDTLDEMLDKDLEEKVQLKIKQRYDDLKRDLDAIVESQHRTLADQLQQIKEVYRNELRNSFSSLFAIEKELKAYKQEIRRRDFLSEKPIVKIQTMDKRLEKIDNYMREKLAIAEKCMAKKKHVDFRADNDEIRIKFGDLEYKAGKLVCVDAKLFSNKTTLEKLFKIGDLATGKLPDLSKIAHVKESGFAGHFQRINMVEQLENGDIVTASNDCTIKIWNRDGKCKKTLFGHQSAVKCFKLLSYDKLVSASSSARSEPIVGNQSILSFRNIQRKNHSTIIVWNLSTGLSEKIIQGPAASIYSIEVADNGDLITADSDGCLSLWDLESGNCKKRKLAYEDKDESNFPIIKLKDRLVTGAARNQEDEKTAKQADETRIKIWDFELNECEKHPFFKLSSHHKDDVTCLVRVDEASFLSGSADGVVKFWNIDPKAARQEPIEATVKERIRTIKVVEKDDDKGERKTKQFFCLLDKGFSGLFEIDEKNGELKEQVVKIENDALFAECEKAYCMEVTDSKEILVALRNKKEENLIWVFGEKN